MIAGPIKDLLQDERPDGDRDEKPVGAGREEREIIDDEERRAV
jgi:hypothetical protein